MSKPKITTHEEVVNKYIGEQGTPKRDKFDAEVKDYTQSFNRLKSFVENMNGGWYDEDNQQPFIEHGINLVELGMSIDEVEQILQSLYSAVASEYGE